MTKNPIYENHCFCVLMTRNPILPKIRKFGVLTKTLIHNTNISKSVLSKKTLFCYLIRISMRSHVRKSEVEGRAYTLRKIISMTKTTTEISVGIIFGI